MNKSDLKTGMRIVTRNGSEFIVLENVMTPSRTVQNMYVKKDGGFMSEGLYNEDLTAKSGQKEWDIVKVYVQNQGEYLDAAVISGDIECMDLIWERDDKKEMTIQEIEKELGYSIKIVKEK